jgi:hypothetical protein
MRIELELDLTVTPRTKRAIKWFAIPFAVLAGSAAIAHAWTADTSWIATGGQVSASKLNAILNEADTRLKALEGPTFQGTVGSGGVSSYPTAHAACASAYPKGHMCSGPELTRASASASIPQGWVIGAGIVLADASATLYMQDCAGFGHLNDNSSSIAGLVWSPSGTFAFERCNVSHPLLCCR